MRLSIVLLSSVLILSGCSGAKSVSNQTNSPSAPEQGMRLAASAELPFSSETSGSVAKIYRGNTFSQSGAFVSPDGLFLTNFAIALDYFSTYTPGDLNWLRDGFSASKTADELPLPGVSIMIPTEQTEVTPLFEDALTDATNNLEVAQIKQSVAQELINQKKAENPEAFVQVHELNSGNRQLLVVYKVLNDVRLAYAPPTNLSTEDLEDSKHLVDTFADRIVLVRAYDSGESPYQSTNYLTPGLLKNDSQPVYALGFPDRTYRQESSRALTFYYSETNPYIIDSYTAYLNKENSLVAGNPTRALQTLPSRYNIADAVEQYRAIQSSFADDSILVKKQKQEAEFSQWVEMDTVLGSRYQDILYFIDQAYDIAEQQGASFYITSYAMALGSLDEISTPFRTFLDADQTDKTPETIASEEQSLIQAQQSMLPNINMDAELDLLREFILILTSLPEEKHMFIIQDIFANTPPEKFEKRATDFIKRNGASSVLFNPQKAAEALQSNTLETDSLFALLDEIVFTNQMARNNQSIYMAYLQPAQQVYAEAQQEMNPDLENHPDANGTLRINRGYWLPEESGTFLTTNNDFSGKAPGSVLVTQDGKLLGLIRDRKTELISSNYLYQAERVRVQAIPITAVIRQILDSGSEALIQELGLK